ncbi:Hypothetical protein CAP_7652 [Chondromyces apiculatus DSM 436]|uniref:Uncharacterized protein n=1 Tax=Chondromyces apiculatus DSM 436 TaxID=1192034 RepID=A0A017SY19_9BACT|nr:Hypothetical protein CAP_7652 [Chondromyces apiculatus DSM 436]
MSGDRPSVPEPLELVLQLMDLRQHDLAAEQVRLLVERDDPRAQPTLRVVRERVGGLRGPERSRWDSELRRLSRSRTAA